MPGAEAAQCHGIAQHVHGSDAVLPAVTHRAHEQIRRAWVDVSEAPLPIGPCFAAQPQRARREKRYADNRIEGRPVAMPANASTRRIFGHHELFKRLCRHSADLVCDLGQGAEVVRDAGIGAGLLPCEDIAMAKAVDTAIAQVAVELEWFEGQLFELPYKGIFLRRRKNIREGMESIRQFRLTEEIGRAAIAIALRSRF